MEDEISLKEKRIRAITQLYYSRPEVQKEMFEFSKHREISPRYFEGFGKRPDSFQYIGDIFGLVKNGATSFHSSEEIWENPLDIKTGMTPEEANKLRIGWDLLIDIDCKYFDFAKLAAKAILETFKQHGIQNVGIKFSGSKGFHLLIPWKAFPKFINGINTKELFPELPRILAAYIRYYSEKTLKEILPENFEEELKHSKIKKGIKCKKCNEIAQVYRQVEFYCKFCRMGEIRKVEEDKKFKCPECNREYEIVNEKEIFECKKCNISSTKYPNLFSKTISSDLYELMGLDIVLVSPRHLFRMPYSLHEKTALASVVISKEELENFDLTKANPMLVEVRNFTPNSEDDEAAELVMQALDWAKSTGFDKEFDKSAQGKYADFKPIKLEGLKEEQFPPCIKKILLGIEDGKKRALFALINLFRSVGMDKERMEKIIYEWNDKNKEPLKKAYIHAQLSWTYKRKPILPPNCRDFYVDLGVCNPDSLCSRIKNPVNYLVKSNLTENKTEKNEKPRQKNN